MPALKPSPDYATIEQEFEATIKIAFSHVPQPRFIYYDNRRQEFSASAIAFGISQGWLTGALNEIEEQYSRYEARLTDAGRAHFGLQADSTPSTAIYVRLAGLETPLTCVHIEDEQPVFNAEQAERFADIYQAEASECVPGEYNARSRNWRYESYNTLQAFSNLPDTDGLYRIGARSPEGPWAWEQIDSAIAHELITNFDTRNNTSKIPRA